MLPFHSGSGLKNLLTYGSIFKNYLKLIYLLKDKLLKINCKNLAFISLQVSTNIYFLMHFSVVENNIKFAFLAIF